MRSLGITQVNYLHSLDLCDAMQLSHRRGQKNGLLVGQQQQKRKKKFFAKK